MHRRHLLQKLRAYAIQFPQEQETCSDYIDFVENEPDCLKRSLQKGHVTASCWILCPERDEVLLTHHRKLGIWIQLGGHLDGGEDVLDAALREAREESGIPDIRPISESLLDLDIHQIPENRKEVAHLHYDARFLFQAGSKNFQISSESLDLAWVPLDRLEDYSDEDSILRMREKQEILISGR